jgi:predicted RNA-binding protein YlqC (UPF0109 family)
MVYEVGGIAVDVSHAHSQKEECSMNTMSASKATADDLGELVTFIATSIVDDPTQVQVNQVTGKTRVTYELSVAPGDVGRVIGKHGRTVNAIRTLLRAASRHQRKRTDLEIIA